MNKKREPTTLRNWRAERSGARITVYGEDIALAEDHEHRKTKITNIDVITPPTHANEHHVLATDKDGVVHKLTFA